MVRILPPLPAFRCRDIHRMGSRRLAKPIRPTAPMSVPSRFQLDPAPHGISALPAKRLR